MLARSVAKLNSNRNLVDGEFKWRAAETVISNLSFWLLVFLLIDTSPWNRTNILLLFYCISNIQTRIYSLCLQIRTGGRVNESCRRKCVRQCHNPSILHVWIRWNVQIQSTIATESRTWIYVVTPYYILFTDKLSF